MVVSRKSKFEFLYLLSKVPTNSNQFGKKVYILRFYENNLSDISVGMLEQLLVM